MSKFDVTDWVDFVRGVVDQDARERMSEQLESGDAVARRTVEVLSRVADVARADREGAVPEDAVRMAKAIGSIQRPRQPASRSALGRVLPFEITFDSLSEPAPAGVRDVATPFRQLSFQADGFQVDVRMEPDADPGTTVLVGQVLSEGAAPRPVSQAPVLLVSDGRIVDSSVTSRFGEFHAEGLPRDHLDLYVLVGEETCLKLPLDPDAAE